MRELANPIAALLGLTTVLRPYVRTGPGRELLALVHREAARVATVAKALQRAADDRGGAGHGRPVDLLACLQTALNAERDRLLAHGVDVEIVLPPSVPLVRADLRRLVQALTLLIVDATHAMLGRSTRRALRVTMDVEDLAVHCHLTHHGPWRTPADLARCFDPVVPLREGVATPGAGLWLVHSLLTGMGGSVRATADVTHGTTITLTLSIASADDAAAGPRRPQRLLIAAAANAVTQRLAGELHVLGHDVDLVSDAVGVVCALDRAVALERAYDRILVGTHLQRVPAIELLAVLRDRELGELTRVVLLSDDPPEPAVRDLLRAVVPAPAPIAIAPGTSAQQLLRLWPDHD